MFPILFVFCVFYVTHCCILIFVGKVFELQCKTFLNPHVDVCLNYDCSWCCSKLVKKTSKTYETLRFLLDHPRRCFIYLFPNQYVFLCVLRLLSEH
jgi:hypothetical protein